MSITLSPASLPITAVAGDPLTIFLTTTFSDQFGNPLSASVASNPTVSVVNAYYAVQPPLLPSVISTSASVFQVAWSAAQTTAISNAGNGSWSFSLNINGTGPYAVVAGKLTMTPTTFAGSTTSTSSIIAVSVGTVTAAVNVTVAGGSSSGGAGSGVTSINGLSGVLTVQSSTLGITPSGTTIDIEVPASSYDPSGYARSASIAAVASSNSYSYGITSAASVAAETFANSQAIGASVAAVNASNSYAYLITSAASVASEIYSYGITSAASIAAESYAYGITSAASIAAISTSETYARSQAVGASVAAVAASDPWGYALGASVNAVSVSEAFVVASYAPLASPALTGVPTAPTANASVSTNQIATTAFAASVANTALLSTGSPVYTVAKPTGLTATDTPNIETAISALNTAGGGGTLLFQDGTYQVDSNAAVIRSCSNFTVKSTGATHITQAPNRSGLVNNTTGDLFVIADSTDFVVTGITFDALRDIVSPMTPLSAAATSGQPSVTVASGFGMRYLVGQKLYIFGGLGTSEQNQSEGFGIGAGTPLVIQSISTGGGSGGGDLITFTTNLTSSYTHISSTAVSDVFGPYAYAGAYITSYQCATNNSVAGRTLGGEDQQNGLHLLNCHRFLISGVTSRNTWESPIKIGSGESSSALTDACSLGVIEGNNVYHGYDQGISVWLSSQITVSNNITESTGWAGVCFTASDYGAISENVILSPVYQVPGDAYSGSGAVVEGGSGNLVFANTILTPYQHGLQIIQSPLFFGLNPASYPSISSFMDVDTAGGTSIQVSSSSSFQVGGKYSILDGPFSEAFTVASKPDSTHVTFVEASQFAHAAGTLIIRRIAQENVVEANSVLNAGQSGINAVQNARSVIKNNVVNGYGANAGVTLSPSYGINGAYDTLNLPSGSGLGADGAHVEGNIVSNGQNSYGTGILFNGTASLQVRANRVNASNGYGPGMDFKGVTDSVIADNEVDDINGSNGIVVETGGVSGSVVCARLTIAGNVVRRNQLDGIVVVLGDSLTITNNVSQSNGGSGIDLQGVTRSIISNNICNSNSTAGILLADSGSTYTEYNRITGNTCREDGSGFNILGGTFTQTYGIEETGHSNYNVITENEADANTTGQITTLGANTLVFNNIISGAIASPPLLAGLQLVAETAEGGYSLINGTGTILTWTAPNDGALHCAVIIGSLNVLNANEVGGVVQVAATIPNGSTIQTTFLNGSQGQYAAVGNFSGAIVGPNRTAQLLQTTAMTSSASAVVWAQIWAS